MFGMRRMVPFNILVVAALVVGACAAEDDGEAESAQQGGVVKIGLVTDLSGETAEIGKQLREAAEFAVDEINQGGGIEALGGAKFELLVENSQGVPENAVAGFNKLVQRDIVAAIGALTSPPTFAMGQEAERVQIPVVVDTAAGEELVRSGLTYLVRLSQGARQEGEGQVGSLEAIETALGRPIKKIAFLGWDGTPFVDDELEAIEQMTAEAGIDLAEVVRFTEGQRSYSSEVAKIRAANPDAVLWCVLGQSEALSIVREYVQQGLDPLRVPLVNCSVTITDPAFEKAAGDLSNGLYTVQGWFAGLPGTKTELWDKFESATGFAIYDLPAFEVQAVYVLKAAMEVCACTDSDAVNEALHNLVLEPDSPDYILQPGPGIEFDEDGVNLRVLVGVYQWQNGELVPIWPPDIASVEPLVRD